ncbi:MAG: HEAT repeat domain-containing protein [Planctomycetota bacterium]
MRPGGTILCAFACSLSAALVAAGECVSDETVQALIERLGNEDYEVRESATRALAALRGQAIPAIERALDSTDPEVRERCAVLLTEIRGLRQVAPALEALVRIDVRDGNLEDLLIHISERSGVPIVFDSTQPDLLEKKITFQTVRLSLKQVMSLLVRHFGLEFTTAFGFVIVTTSDRRAKFERVSPLECLPREQPWSQRLRGAIYQARIELDCVNPEIGCCVADLRLPDGMGVETSEAALKAVRPVTLQWYGCQVLPMEVFLALTAWAADLELSLEPAGLLIGTRDETRARRR